MEGVNGQEILRYVQLNPKVKIDFILLDLDMPIMDGYEACRQIIDFYKNTNIFKLEESKKFEPSKKVKSNRDVSMSVNNIIEEKYTHPLMVAYSALVNDSVLKECKEAGFKVVIESPLSVKLIKEQILSLLE